MSRRQSRLSIETPEGVVFSYDLATPVSRALAWAIDASAIATACYLAGQLSAGFNLFSRDVAAAVTVVLYFVISMAYGILLEWRWRGQTLGKRVLGLRVIDVQGLHLQLPQIVVRNLLRLLDILPLFYLVGGLACALSRNAQRLGDLAANTVVARERQQEQPDLERIAPAKYNSLLAWPHLTARLRSLVTPDAVAIAVRAVAMRDGYDPVARIELFAELAAHFRSLVQFPSEAVEALTDEQYVRCVLRVIYAPTVGAGSAFTGRSRA
jgi:uncharacterized RDD family membrane protein YckC